MLAVITGASAGIGRALALELASRNYSLIIAARRENLLNELKAEVKKLYPEVTVTVKVIDLSDMTANAKFVKELEKQPVDLFVNNAGFGYWGNLLEQDSDRVDNMLVLLVNALTYFTQEVGKQMAKKDGGLIINIASIGGYNSVYPGNAVYAAAKRYVMDFSRSVNYENKRLRNNVRILAVSPGAIESDWIATASEGRVAEANPKFKQTPAPVFAKNVFDKAFTTRKDEFVSGKLGYLSKLQGKLPLKLKLGQLYKISHIFAGTKKD